MDPIARAILIIAAVAVTGLAIGGIRIRGMGFGAAGVLFTGLVFGNFGATIDHDIAHFAKEFGLILFVFTIGLQLGPGIVKLWKRYGLLLNGMAVAIVVQGLLLTLALTQLLALPSVTSAGLFSGATTNTPSLGAAAQAAALLDSNASPAMAESLTASYAVAYPGGILGIIASMLIIRRLFGVDVHAEVEQLRAIEIKHEPLRRQSIVVDNEHLVGTPFREIAGVDETGVRISRVRRAGEEMVHPANEKIALQMGDLIQVVGTKDGIARFVPLIGRASEVDLMRAAGDATFRRISVTAAGVLDKTLQELSLDHFFNVTITRIHRAGVEVTPRGSSRLHYGDMVQVVGDQASLDEVTRYLGNSAKSLRETPFSPLFIGIALGVLLGMIPVTLPGVPFAVRLGLAGGPLVAAILLSLVGRIGKVVWYVPYSANLALRELGIILFLACAGLSGGPVFFETAFSAQGAQWMAAGLVVTMIPLLTTAVVTRLWWKQNYLTICGVIAGSMTDPPALAFANSQADSDACSTAYAAVYPLTMILRIVAAQAIVFSGS